MEVFAHRLLSELIAGAGTRLVAHYDLNKSVLPQAKYPIVFSEDNARVHFEDEAIEIDRPLSKDIFLVGSLSFDEIVRSYAVPIDRTYQLDGETKRVNTNDNLIRITSIIRITMITNNEVPKQARGKLRYMMQFVIMAFTSPPTQNWWEWPARVTGFTSTVNVPMMNVLGNEEELIIGKSIGVKLEEDVIRSEHLTLEKL